MKIKHAILASLAFGLLFTSCENDNDDNKRSLGDYDRGILISNEGPFQNGSGTVSYVSYDLNEVENEIYKKVNNEDLGNIVQSIGFYDKKAFIVVNNSNAIVVADRFTFKKLGAITEGLHNPRYFTAANGKGYVTNWGDPNDNNDDFVAIINLVDFTVEGTIPVEFGPEVLEEENDMVYVAHQGAWGFNNKISVIDPATDKVVKIIPVGDVPNSMAFDDADNLWVMCAGKPSYSGEETKGELVKINTTTNTVANTFEFTTTDHPKQLVEEDNSIYYTLNSNVYSMTATATSLPTSPLLEGVSFYTMRVDDGKLYGTDAKDYNSKGDLTIYNINSKEIIKTIPVGIIPGGIYFN
ncbi:40-residue YVTN family beta-propeller repeat-containing protein [Arenibacter nanhaiticus]|uniref:40-residue YVTN family beta-propeller repeat-containing protein n=1 Tax=Arenibacter nanhaiticus TaxID=558155 RepID=A0A1M6EEC9_9FLAO|nr:DUF5074 domain-containing protein [Arenibacter nanhaiticus]SHI83670.1 40-residue YVTN family beta-propeller repeat-containing protein [Arenibacter nanhaiticus]